MYHARRSSIFCCGQALWNHPICMLRVDKSLSYLNDMLYHPCMFRLDPLKQMYVSKSTLNSGVNLDSSTLFLPYHLLHYKRLQSSLHLNCKFLIFLVFKLLERGVYISARNVAILETPAARAMHQTPRPNTAMEISSITGLQQNDQHDPQEDVEKDNATNVTKANRKIVHYDIIAFNAKKKHVYAIVACDDILKFQQCRAHALRGVKSSFLGRKNMLKKKSSKSKISCHLLAYTRTCLLCTHIYTHICRDLVHLDFESAGPPSVSSRMHSRDVSCTINVETVFKVNHAFRALSRIRTEHLSLRLG